MLTFTLGDARANDAFTPAPPGVVSVPMSVIVPGSRLVDEVTEYG